MHKRPFGKSQSVVEQLYPVEWIVLDRLRSICHRSAIQEQRNSRIERKEVRKEQLLRATRWQGATASANFRLAFFHRPVTVLCLRIISLCTSCNMFLGRKRTLMEYVECICKCSYAVTGALSPKSEDQASVIRGVETYWNKFSKRKTMICV